MKYLKTYKIFEGGNQKEIDSKMSIVADCLQEIFDDYNIQKWDYLINGRMAPVDDPYWSFSHFNEGEVWKCQINIKLTSKKMLDSITNDIQKITPIINDRINGLVMVFTYAENWMAIIIDE